MKNREARTSRMCGAGALAIVTGSLLAAGTGCNASCSVEANTAVIIQVMDSLTRGLVSSDTVVLVAREANVLAGQSTVRDTLRVTRALTVQPVTLLIERTGRFTIEVFAAGYKPWRLDGLQVDEECHVRPVELTALMQRL